jgi:hypothetical protein
MDMQLAVSCSGELMSYKDDFTQYYYLGGELKVASVVSEVPEDVDDFTTINEAIFWMQKLGCIGRHVHGDNPSNSLLLEVMRIAVEKYGQVFPLVYRGVRSNRPDAQYKILYGALDKNVAAFYGNVKVYRNVRGLLTRSLAKPVLADETTPADEADEEIIFFPS